MDILLSTIIGGLIAVLGSILAAFLTHKLERRLASDKELFSVWRMAFDRPAFKGPFTWHSDQQAFRRTIDLTLKAVNTGVLLDRQGVELGRGKGKAYIRDAKKRSVMDTVEKRLQRIQNLIPRSSDPQVEKVATAIDQERNEIIRSLNNIWNSLEIPLLPLPTDANDYNDVLNI
jgi:hypothetical protein